VGFAKGPIYGYWWIKRRGKIVWTQDPNAPIEDAAYAAKWAEKVAMYFGTKDQLPDSTIESYEGTGQVSAFRDDAYIVVEEDDVTDGGGAVPTYEACVIASPPEAYLTSHPYELLFDDAVSYGLTPVDGALVDLLADAWTEEDVVSFSLLPVGGVLALPLESIDVELNDISYSLTPTAGVLKAVLIPASVELNQVTYSLTPTGGQLRQVLIASNVQLNEITYSLTPVGGTLA
jgi:hypothetical protein